MDADDLFNQGIEQFKKSQFREALASWEQALALYRKISDVQKVASTLGNLGSVYDILGQSQRAIDYYELELTISQEIGDRQGEANALGNIGTTYQSLGQYQQALDYYQKSLKIERDIQNLQGEAISLGNLGTLYEELGQYEKGRSYYQQALKIKREIGDLQGEAYSLGNIGNAYHALGQHEIAIGYHQQSRKIKRALGDRQGEASSLGNIGLAYYSLEQYQTAIEYHQNCLDIAKEIGDRKGQISSLGNLANGYYLLGQYREAFYCYWQQSNLAMAIGHLALVWTSMSNLGTLFGKTQDPEILSLGERGMRIAMKACEILRTDLEDRNQVSLFETQIRTYCNLQKVLIAQDKPIEALEISERGRTRAFINLLRQRFPEESNPYISAPQIRQVAQTQNATLVEYSIVTEELYIWVIQPTGNIEFRRSPITGSELDDLENLILRARASIGIKEKDKNGQTPKLNPEETPHEGYLKYLYNILIAPITDLLPADPEARAIFIPHYALYLVPFAALQNPQGRYLIEDHTLLTAPSIQVLETTHAQQQRQNQTHKKALVVAEPTLHPKFQDEPYKLNPYDYMKEAGESIAAILNTTAITGYRATKVAVINRLLQVDTRTVHIFAHALQELDPLDRKPDLETDIPGVIILAPDGDDDGALYAEEILDLDLNSEIVVLSACSTGKGKITGDGIIGLSRCFILAGVPSLVVSLWNIGAPAAKVLMTEFYQNLANRKNRAAALRHAMLNTKTRFPKPESWSGFTLIGETHPLTLTTQQIEEALRTMSIPENATPEAIVKAFTDLFDYYEPEFLTQIQGLDLQPTDSIATLAAKIKTWCKTHPNVEENIENDLSQMGPNDANDEEETPEEVVKRAYEKYLENLNRLGQTNEKQQ
ncbi:MAG: CHAT domain-containing protein [Roseofilum sp. SBFL]|uniref:CHAT domain-containing protein n=1 Tax=unclassified Roseofilum TaxID=2620099 RepID=UPI001B17D58C|nr:MULTISPECIES: CHAT domain-containing tetratricopeptide repeat protein [unclassified Roseofilum]MBP0013247.1 CHAT domain-containing protein [Roseofilum sp. SID3]MBP0026407.1 CHAT domain-containing protein [Roseofilum sp. SID2]MBP0038238.1 CHAT domain-containing protein [Roseofilum sp. SID1]MBP0040841.1 CHAT domain-containing protein [Roseofilum sp. SBFL]